MISAEQFLDLLQKKDLLEPDMLRDLRKRVARSETPVKATLIAQRLVDKGHLSKILAKRLLQQAEEGGGPGPAAMEPDGDDLGLVPLEEEQEEELGLLPLEEEMDGPDLGASEEDDWGLELVDEPPPAKKPARKPPKAKKPPVARPVGKSPKKPAPKPAARAKPKPTPKATPKLAAKATPKPAAKATPKPAAKATPKPLAKPSEKPPRKVAVKPVEKPAPAARPAKPVPVPVEESPPEEPVPAEASLESLLDESAFDGDPAEGSVLDVAPRRRGLFKSRRAKKNIWDSNLLLFGGGGLLVLGILLTVLVSTLVKRNPEEMLSQANDLYRDGTYTKAIDVYSEYLKKYSDKEGSSRARIMLGLARMRQATSEGGDWPRALGVANDELEQISGEDEFMTEARGELTAMLPDIADGLSQLARKKLDPALLDKSADALALVEKYVPKSSRPLTRLTDIRAVLDLTRREIARGERLQEAIATMGSAVSDGKTEEAYQVRRSLLKEYPGLLGRPELREAVLAVAEAEFGLVKMIDEARQALPPDEDAAALRALALAKRTANRTASGAEGQVVFAVAEGAAYGLDASSGKVLWRRYIGFASDSRGVSFPSTEISAAVGGRSVLVNWEDDEVLQLDAASGAIQWRFPVGEKFDAQPVTVEDRLLLATRSGRLWTIDAATGSSPGYLQLTQQLRIAPLVDPKNDNIYQVGEHSSLFVLSLASGEAKQVLYLGHEPGSVVCPPVLIGGFLVVAEDDGIESSTLNVLALSSEEGEPPLEPIQEIEVKGHVGTSPSVSGPRMLVVTDRGDISVFELSGDDEENPLGRIAGGKAADDDLLSGHENLVRFPFLIGGQAWVADSQLTRYDVQAARGLLQDKWIRNPGSPALQPPMALGQTIFQIRRKLGMPGVLVAALEIDEGKTIWETQLAAPLVGEPWIDAQSGRITAASAPGAVFSIDPADLEGDAVDVQPTAALPPTAVRSPLTDAVPLGREAVALVIVDGPNEIRVFDPQAPGTRFRSFRLPSPAACRPTVFSGGVLVPVTGGQTLFLNVANGLARTEPFQPPLQSGIPVAWQPPVLNGDDEVVLTDGVSGLFRVKIQQQPKPHLAAVASAPLDDSIISPIAICGGKVYAVGKSQSLISFDLPDLKAGNPRPLSARVAWGPETVGDRVLLATDDEMLYSIDAEGKVRTENLPHGPLAGTPIVVDGQTLFAATKGVLWKTDAATGEELARVDLKIPLETGPVLLGDRILVGGRDGSLYRVDKP